MEKNMLIWIGVFIIAYFILRAYFFLNRQGSVVDKEISDIVDSDKYKVKGQYD